MHSTRIHNPNLPIFAPFCRLYRDILAGGDVVEALAGIVLKREETTPFVSVAQHLFFNFLFSTFNCDGVFVEILLWVTGGIFSAPILIKCAIVCMWNGADVCMPKFPFPQAVIAC